MNKITIELSAEDRALLGKIADRLEALTPPTFTIDPGVGQPKPAEKDELTAALQAVVDRAKNAPGEAEKIDPPTIPKTEETPTATEEPQHWDPIESFAQHTEQTVTEKPKPAVTLAQIQQKVVQLAAGSNGSKKAKVREIINAYAKKVSDLPEDKWDEVWDKLTALENEE